MHNQRRRTGITVTGTGSAPVAVDRVTVVIAIAETRADAGEAFQAAAHTATRVLAILADDGADSRSVRTADLTLGPRTEWRDNSEVLLGYQAGQRLILQLTGLSGIERMLTDVASGSGGEVRIESLTLTPSNPVAALRQAREAAYLDALATAEQLAGLAARPLGPVSWIVDGVPPSGGAPRTPGPRVMAAKADVMPIAAGDAEVTVVVTVHWEFAD